MIDGKLFICWIRAIWVNEVSGTVDFYINGLGFAVDGEINLIAPACV